MIASRAVPAGDSSVRSKSRPRAGVVRIAFRNAAVTLVAVSVTGVPAPVSVPLPTSKVETLSKT